MPRNQVGEKSNNSFHFNRLTALQSLHGGDIPRQLTVIVSANRQRVSGASWSLVVRLWSLVTWSLVWSPGKQRPQKKGRRKKRRPFGRTEARSVTEERSRPPYRPESARRY